MKTLTKNNAFCQGFKHGIPIGIGYFAVAFSLGIAARNAGLTPFQGFISSVLANASAGEYAFFTLIAAHASYFEVALITLITNARYLLMSCALSQRISPSMPFWHRLTIGFDITDELFGIYIARPGYLSPAYCYGAMAVAIPGWSIGTAMGIIMGNLLPLRLVSALSVALYGMFLAIIIPPSRKNKVILGLVTVSFLCSFIFYYIPVIRDFSDGNRTIILTIAISAAGALLYPVSQEEKNEEEKNA